MSQDRLDASLDIDRRSTLEIVRIIQEQDALVGPAVAAEAQRIAHAVDEIANRLTHGGRMFYVGAGTSGRIAMLDAAELPPTFGIDSSLVRVLMAGGERAFFAAAEGSEDDEDAAIAAIEREVVAEDAVVGIAASGTTPYTVAAIRKANMLGALTVGITSQPGSPLAQDSDIAIVPRTGPEVIMGSSRMKSGTAQKLVLNAISTAVMIRLGRVYSNLMIDMPATNEKLRNRAVRMVELAAGVLRPTAVQAIRGEVFAAAVERLLRDHNIDCDDVDIVASAGQTIWHDPEPVVVTESVDWIDHPIVTRSTFAIGQSAVIAERTGITTVGDLRVRDVAAGGQGAPLIAYADWVLLRDETLGRCIQNIGGISNVTYLPPAATTDDVVAFDTGPGNMVIDALTEVATRGALKYDKDGVLAASGNVIPEQLDAWMDDGYFRRPPPKTTGREHFGVQF